jgi:hypothetical protein
MGEQRLLNKDGTSNDGRALAAMGAFTGVALMCNVELFVLISTKFKRRSGLYFWSLLVASVGALLHSIEVILFYFVVADLPPWSFGITGVLGYLLYIPAQYLVLYSRLCVLSSSTRLLRWVLALISAEFIIVTIPEAFIWAAELAFPDSTKISQAGNVIQKIEVCAYTAVEIILSGIYIVQMVRMWERNSDPCIRTILKRLIFANSLLVILDAGNVTMQFMNIFGLDDTWLVCYTRDFLLLNTNWVLGAGL